MSDIRVVEVSPRDGLQNEPVLLTTETKVELVRRCVAAGVTRAEVASFAHPERVPQMADAEAVVAGLPRVDEVSHIGLGLNRRSVERATVTALDEVNLVVVSTDTFSQRNQGMTTDGAVALLADQVTQVRAAGMRPTVTLAASFGCPFEGEVPLARTIALAEASAMAGVDEIALADTIGVAVPADVRRRVRAVRDAAPGVALRAHFHNTRNTGYANALAAAEEGVTELDAALGGIGGCPFAPNATGNIATEDLVYALERSGFSTGLDLDVLVDAARWLQEQLGRPVPALLGRAGGFPAVAA